MSANASQLDELTPSRIAVVVVKKSGARATFKTYPGQDHAQAEIDARALAPLAAMSGARVAIERLADPVPWPANS